MDDDQSRDLALRRADRTGEGRKMALAGLVISAVWLMAGTKA
ncbi:hypothetical protein BJ973_003488 [Actinoplanes tereljensis]|uniref:Uncharacterized protein n=1 Tax=Paractinoplanes tereljensis TaxID=571912 RepID=A0A919NXL3_9ACTN|nr:DUF4190 domain-containing protein [Actinoplanes tereljensis]GIF26218.1 hypothetical protein Ate02nite_89480 [Actinoplanes tereljensis]